MEIRHLKAFVAVAEDLNFTRAAEKLFLAQQALSTQIRQLEDEIGTPLFVRTTRKVDLTVAGEAFLPRVLAVLSAMEEAKEVARNVGRGEAGHVHIAYTHSIGIESLPEIINRIHDRSPQLTITAVVTLADQAMSGLARAEFDLAIVRSPEPRPGLVSVPLRREKLGVIVAETHPAARSDVVTVEQLSESTLLLWPRYHSPGYADKVLNTFVEHRDHSRILVYETFTHDGFISDRRAYVEIAEGRAFSTAFECQFEPLPEGMVWRHLVPDLTIDTELLHREGPLTEPQRRFLEIALEVADLNGWLEPTEH